MSVDSKDVKPLFKLETKVGACDEHYSHFLFPLFPLSPHTIASPLGDLRGKKKKQKQKTFTHNNCQLTLREDIFNF